MEFSARLKAFTEFSRILGEYTGGRLTGGKSYQILQEAVTESAAANGWFTRQQVMAALGALANMTGGDQLQQWIKDYPTALSAVRAPYKIAVIMAGNIPLAGFHDFMCVLMHGDRFHGKLSSSDTYLLPACARILTAIEPAFEDHISFSEGRLSGFDAVIATGSNNSSRYFEQYFGSYPNIIRHNRNSAAIITGNETEEEMRGLADDIFMYYGMGCRSVSFLFLPVGYDIHTFFEAMNPYGDVIDHNKYFNNYTYNRSLYLMDSAPFLDNGFLLLRRHESPASPVSVLHYMEYEKPEEVMTFLDRHKDSLQCVVGNADVPYTLVPFGKAQQPWPGDYADGVDTMKFLSDLGNVPPVIS